jgi:DDE_Tnp_1-associated/Transposase DDE domain
MRSLAEALKEVADHRQAKGKRHELRALLVFICTGMLCGCRSLQALTGWGKRQESVLLRAMGFARGQAPGYGTLQRTVKQLDVDSFERALSGWSEGVLKAQGQGALQGIALDGKVLRGSRQGELPGVHLLAALAHQLGITLDQTEVPATTNEHKASIPLLERLSLTNRVVTADAAFMQREVCQLIIQSQGHYLIVLKDNQADLRQTVTDWFEPFPPTGRGADASGRDA